jgi:hypothetical protein
MKIQSGAAADNTKVMWLGCALMCFLIIGTMILFARSQRVDEQAHETVRAWLARKNGPNAIIVIISLQDKPGFKGRAVRVEYTINGKPAKKSPRYLLIRRGLLSSWEVAYEISEAQYLNPRVAQTVAPVPLARFATCA